jgi:hypothetical protein
MLDCGKDNGEPEPSSKMVSGIYQYKNKNPALYCRALDLTRIKHLIDCLTKTKP